MLFLVVIHQGAKEKDFELALIKERMQILKGIFENSRFDICGNLNIASMGFINYLTLSSNVNYVLTGTFSSCKEFRRNTGLIFKYKYIFSRLYNDRISSACSLTKIELGGLINHLKI